jgi:hypothetical protein
MHERTFSWNPDHSERPRTPSSEAPPEWQPPITNHMVLTLGVIHCFRIFVVFVYLFVLKLQGWLDIFLGHISKLADQWKRHVCSRATINRLWVTIAVNRLYCIAINLGTINHKSFEVYVWYTNFCHNKLQIFLKENLYCTIFRLNVTTHNS